MANEAPAWLSNETAAAPSAPLPTMDPKSKSKKEKPAAASMLASSGAALTPEELRRDAQRALQVEDEAKELPQVILVMRLANMGAAVALMVCSILLMISFPTPAKWVLSVYATCGGLLVCCLETQLKFLRVMIAINFGFLFSPFFRFIFYCIMASVCWAYDNLFGKIVGIVLIVVAVYNTYVLARYPSYRKIRDKIAEEEDKRIEAKISQQVKKQAVNQLKKDWAGGS